MARTRVRQTPWNRNNQTRPRNKQFKVKKLLPESKKFQVKQNRRIVRTMNVKRIAHYFSGRKKRTY